MSSFVIRSAGRLIGPFGTRSAASSLAVEMRRFGLDAKVEQLSPPAETRDLIRLPPRRIPPAPTHTLYEVSPRVAH